MCLLHSPGWSKTIELVLSCLSWLKLVILFLVWTVSSCNVGFIAINHPQVITVITIFWAGEIQTIPNGRFMAARPTFGKIHVRSHNCMQNIGVRYIGDLVTQNESDKLCPSFVGAPQVIPSLALCTHPQARSTA